MDVSGVVSFWRVLELAGAGGDGPDMLQQRPTLYIYI